MHSLLMIRSPLQRAMLLAMVAAIITIALKLGAWKLTGSLGLFSDAMESLVNLAAAVLGFVLLGLAALPADDNHPFGHDKAEYFSSGAEGMMILFAAVAIAWQAVKGFLQPHAVGTLDMGMALSFVATLVNAAAAWWLLRVAKREESLAIEADARHLLTDVWTSVGVIAALGLLMVFPTAHWIDPLIALVVALNIVRTGVSLMHRSVDGLMDVQLPAAEFSAIENALKKNLPAHASIQALRTRRAGARRFVEFNLLLPGAWSVNQSHDVCDELESAVRGAYPDTDIVIHVEPAELYTAAPH